MPAMKTDEIRGKSPEVLAAEFAAMKRELFDLRFKSASQSLPDPSRIRVLRRTIARMGTVVRERELKASRASASGAGAAPGAAKVTQSAKGKRR
jgi:large subunit ribosomal protein L29